MPSKYFEEQNLIHPDMETKSFICHFGQEYAAKTYFMAKAKQEILLGEMNHDDAR